jgi:diphosphomevalonate decarboxylase
MSPSPLSRLKDIPSPGQLSNRDNLKVSWQSPSNIALVKYWGKKNGQFPINPSLSMTLERAVTQTHIKVLANEALTGVVSVNGDPDHPFIPKMQKLFQWMSGEIPVLKKIGLAVTTENSFPHSTGIASSASGISAFTLGLLSIADEILHAEVGTEEFFHMASYIARMGSGSASRSMYGGFTVWGETNYLKDASDEFAIPVPEFIHPDMLLLHDAILVVSGVPKSLSSTLGHKSMDGHPFSGNRIGQAQRNLENTLHALSANDFEQLGSIAECEALTLHALLMSANPGILLLKPATVEVIHRVRNARKNGLPMFFTLDAGANVHVMYPHDSAPDVEKFIKDALQPLCEDGRVIFDGCGSGPERLNQPDLLP